MFQNGFITFGRWHGIPLRMHWSTPLGAVVFGRFEFVPGFWLGFFLLILLHELGHAFVVRRAGARVVAVDVMAMGGRCAWQGEVTGVQRAAIAWAGVWAQLLLLSVALVSLAVVLGTPEGAAMAQLVDVFTRTNLWVMALNLLPVPPLDGAEAWLSYRCFGNERRGGGRSADANERKPPLVRRLSAAMPSKTF